MRSLVLEDTRRLAWHDVPEPQRGHEREAIVRPLAVATCDGDQPMIFGQTPLPLFELFTRGVHLHIGRAMARPVIPAILDLVAAGRLRPRLVTSATVAWDDAPEALVEPATKLVVSRG